MRQILRKIRHLKNPLVPGKHAIFFHLPKTAGSAIAGALGNAHCFKKHRNVDLRATRDLGYAAGDIAQTVFGHAGEISEFQQRMFCHFSREAIVHQMVKSGINLIHGHLLYSERLRELAKPQYKFITVLREPMGRMLSQYSFSRASTQSFDEFLEDPLTREYAIFTTSYLGGLSAMSIAQRDPEAAFEIAKANLPHFDLIGFQENLGQFADDFHRVFGSKLRIKKVNVTEKKIRLDDLTDEQVERLRELVKWEIKLFEAAQSMTTTSSSSNTAR